MISSRSISIGFIASARTMATRCCWPPESRSGYSSALSSRPMSRKELPRLARAPRPWAACAPGSAPASRSRSRSCAGTRLYAWNTIPIFRRSAFTSTFVPVMTWPSTTIVACVDVLEQVDAAKERRLARARGADQAHDLVQVDCQVDPVQDLEVAEALRDVLERDEVRVRARHRACARSRCSRSLTRWSVKRASGIVRMMKNTAATVKPA